MSDVIDILRYERLDTNQVYAMATSIRRLEDHILGEVDSKPVTTANPPVRKFTVSSKALARHASVVDVTVLFFSDDFPAGMALEQRSDSWKDMDEKEKKSHRNRYSSIKRAVRMVVMHMDSFPLVSDRDFKSTLRHVVSKAIERLRTNYKISEDKTITVHTIASNSQQTPTLEKTMNLPPDLLEV
ncbi:unknown protein [Seminavis robusta]|uniref:Fe/B12 periplasmic-binding domain-containing protein n=1 Tax=Seminavis robusta TaxID=568900 RepID=A0A9N8HXV8_9STRA|nr:unknown protein [Seminavis robusta]|eukprot:Sro3386_g347470.1 n/a (185) ;mRNA; f:2974-3528